LGKPLEFQGTEEKISGAVGGGRDTKRKAITRRLERIEETTKGGEKRVTYVWREGAQSYPSRPDKKLPLGREKRNREI